ncbi:MAG: helix-turn-helix transcriptional regulator [Alphaproteobacteria bacterium]|nr:helix-turn-helix transcriptional regulator [Alphaproteobacteria bacterium]
MKKIISTESYYLFANLLKQARVQANLTQVELARKIGVPQSFVSKYENNERKLDVLEFIKISQLIGLRPTDVIRKFLNEIILQGKKF